MRLCRCHVYFLADERGDCDISKLEPDDIRNGGGNDSDDEENDEGQGGSYQRTNPDGGEAV